jgi:predicted secreted acid phosphatase
MDRHFDEYPYQSYTCRRFSPWRPSSWHLWLVAPVVAAVAVVLAFYAAL